MARFQAQTDRSLAKDLEELRKKVGLKRSQKALLLRELAESALLLLRMTENGLSICLLGKGSRKPTSLELPILERYQRSKEEAERTQELPSIKLSNEEVLSLSEVLNAEFAPNRALKKALERLASPERKPPELSWTSEK